MTEKTMTDEEQLCAMYELMTGMARGSRVFAILDETETTYRTLGAGKYVGHHMHPDLGAPNPKIELDSGKIVWGCECWWGPEDKVKGMMDQTKKEQVQVDIDEIRSADQA